MRPILVDMDSKSARTAARRRAVRKIIAAAALLLAASAPAHAMRCGNRVITRGDLATKMLRFCGEPTAVQSRLAQRTYHGHFGSVILPGFIEDVLIEEWTYNFGPYRLMRLVRVENGIVAEIKQLGYGYTPY